VDEDHTLEGSSLTIDPAEISRARTGDIKFLIRYKDVSAGNAAKFNPVCVEIDLEKP
jgi:hypothetical protein